MYIGQGTYTWVDGCSYSGGWLDNKMHGNGTYVDAERVKFSGEFFNGKFNNGRAYVHLR